MEKSTAPGDEDFAKVQLSQELTGNFMFFVLYRTSANFVFREDSRFDNHSVCEESG